MAPAMNDEQVLWRGTSSQLTNIGPYLVCLLLAAGSVAAGLFFPPFGFALLAVPALWALWSWLVVRCRVYELTAQRLRLSSGVLNRRTDELELYRVKDIGLEEPFWLRMFGLANLELDTSDRSHPKVTIPAIGDAKGLREKLRANVERLRDQKRVREVDFEGGEGTSVDSDLGIG
jgi:uncharacterized membrane protein YdbT with pleckstrin-like domain